MSQLKAENDLQLFGVSDFSDQYESVAPLQAHLKERLAWYRLITTRSEYLQAAQNFPDTAMEYLCLLSKSSITTHNWLWLTILHSLVDTSNALTQLKKRLSLALDIHISSANGILQPVLNQVARHCEIFAEGVDVSVFLATSGTKQTYTKLLEFACALLELLCPEQSYLKHGLLIQSSVILVRKVSEEAGQIFNGKSEQIYDFKVHLLPVLVEISKCAFSSGVCLAILPLLQCSLNDQTLAISESFVPSIIHDPNVSLPLITDYYRYTAFCLVTCAVEGSQIDERLASMADTFLRVLLSFPHLLLIHYMAEALSTNEGTATGRPRLISGSEREEISFFYLLNTLLRLRSLSDFVDPGKRFVKERRFFVASINKRCGAELDYSASASLSRTSSVVSMPRMLDARNALQGIKSPGQSTLSSILTEGTYKEKVRLVAEFMNFCAETGGAGSVKRMVETFDFSSLHHRTNHFSLSSHDVLRIVNRIDPQQYPGKICYVRALDMIMRLVQLITLKFLRNVYGDSLRPADFLSSQFKTGYLLRDVLLVKDLLLLNEDDSVEVLYHFDTSEAEFVAKQFRCLEMTALLKADMQKMV